MFFCLWIPCIRPHYQQRNVRNLWVCLVQWNWNGLIYLPVRRHVRYQSIQRTSVYEDTAGYCILHCIWSHVNWYSYTIKSKFIYLFVFYTSSFEMLRTTSFRRREICHRRILFQELILMNKMINSNLLHYWLKSLSSVFVVLRSLPNYTYSYMSQNIL